MRHFFLPLTLVTALLAAWWALPDANLRTGLAPEAVAGPFAGDGDATVLAAPEGDAPRSDGIGRSDVVPASASNAVAGTLGGPRALTFGDDWRIPDPIRTGPCTLLLHIVDGTSGEAVAGVVTLWRLSAPANSHWKHGDQAQYREEVPEEGGRFENLAAGNYRAVCHAERDDASDPPPFYVSGPITEVTLELALPVERRAWLLLYDEDGTPITEVEMRAGIRSLAPRVVGKREWVLARAPLVPRREDGPHLRGGGAGALFTGNGDQEWRTVSAGEQGFELGSFLGDLRDKRSTHRIEVRHPDGREAEISVQGAHRDERLYLSVLPRREPVLDSLVLPDGGTGRDIADEISVESRELLAGEALTDAPWLEVPISVYVHHPDYQNLSFTYRLGDGPLELRRLSPDE